MPQLIRIEDTFINVDCIRKAYIYDASDISNIIGLCIKLDDGTEERFFFEKYSEDQEKLEKILEKLGEYE